MLVVTTVQEGWEKTFGRFVHIRGFPIYLTEPIICSASRRSVGERCSGLWVQFGHLAAVYRVPTLLSGVSGSRS